MLTFSLPAQRDLRIMFAAMALGCANDPDSGVRAAAIRTLGFAVTFNTLSDVGFFLLYILGTVVLMIFLLLGCIIHYGQLRGYLVFTERCQRPS